MATNSIESTETIEHKENTKCIRPLGLFIGMAKAVSKRKRLKTVRAADEYFEILCPSI